MIDTWSENRLKLPHADGQKATGEPDEPLWRSNEYAADNPNSPRINATILSLVRNNELEGMIQAMKDLERTWNSKFNYPWTFFNDVDFTDEFKKRTQAETKAECRYGTLGRFQEVFLVVRGTMNSQV